MIPRLTQLTYNQTNRSYNRFLLRMIVVLFCAVLSSFNHDTIAQNTTNSIISVDAKETSVADIFENIYKKYNIKIAYNSSDLKKIKVDEYKADNQHIDKIINELLTNTEYSFKHIGNQIVIYRDEAKKIEKKQERELPSREERLRLIVRDTIHYIDTIYLTKYETIQKIDTLRIVVKETDTVYIEKKPIIKTYKDLPTRKLIHNEQFSLKASYSQQMAILNFVNKDHPDDEFTNLLNETIDKISLRSFALNIDGTYNISDWDLSLGISYNSYKHNFSFERVEQDESYISLDTIDTYYDVDIITLDTTYYHIIDTTFIPGNIYKYNASSLNKVSYFGINAAVGYTFYRNHNIALYAKATAGIDILMRTKGKYLSEDASNRIIPLEKELLNKVKFTYGIGFGSKIALTEQLDFIPEIYYKHYCNSLSKNHHYQIKMNVLGIKLGFSYYF